MKTLFLVFLILLVSCSNETQNIPDIVLKFGEDHLEPLLDEGTEKTFIVVLNPSECGSCEKEVIHFVNSVYPHFSSITIIPENVQISSEIDKSETILINRKILAQHGLLNANGSVLIYEGKNCIYFSPIDILNTTKMKDTIIGLGN